MHVIWVALYAKDFFYIVRDSFGRVFIVPEIQATSLENF